MPKTDLAESIFDRKRISPSSCNHLWKRILREKNPLPKTMLFWFFSCGLAVRNECRAVAECLSRNDASKRVALCDVGLKPSAPSRPNSCNISLVSPFLARPRPRPRLSPPLPTTHPRDLALFNLLVSLCLSFARVYPVAQYPAEAHLSPSHQQLMVCLPDMPR